MGVPCPMSRRGTPSQVPGGTPSQVWLGGQGVPHPRSGGGTLSHVRGGTPSQVPGGYPISGLAWGWGVPHLRSEGGTPPPDLGWGTPHTVQIWTGYSPPPDVNRQTPVKTVPSRHTTYAGGKNKVLLINYIVGEKY